MKKNLKKAQPARRCPTAKTIDELLAKYDSIIKLVEQYQAALEPYKQEIVEIADVFGSMPKDAERSRLLTGEIYEALVTRAISLKLDEQQIEKLSDLLERHGASDLFPQLFQQVLSYRIQPDAMKVLAGLVPSRLTKEIRAAFLACQVMKEQAPRVRVDELEVKAAKKKEASA
jgi:hypothetical protein